MYVRVQYWIYSNKKSTFAAVVDGEDSREARHTGCQHGAHHERLPSGPLQEQQRAEGCREVHEGLQEEVEEAVGAEVAAVQRQTVVGQAHH